MTDNSNAGETLIVEVRMPPQQVVFFQSLLQGEDGLAVVRCFDQEKKKLQLWSSAVQKTELLVWLAELPPIIRLEVLGNWLWQEGDAEEA